MYTTHLQTDDMRREALKIELSEKLNELEQKMRRAMAWKVTQPHIDNIMFICIMLYICAMYGSVPLLRGYIFTQLQVAEDFKTPLGPLNALTEAAKKPLGIR